MSRAFTVLTCAQRSPEWYAARAGRLTASDCYDALTMGKSGNELAGRRDLRMRLVLERITGEPQTSDFENDDMRRGRELEDAARLAYAAESGELVEQSGFCSHDSLLIGCSLDGYINDFAGIVEIKAPRPANHFEVLKARSVPDRYLPQVTHALWITGAQWADYVSFCPQFPEAGRLLIVRVSRESVDLKTHEQKALAFLAEVERDEQAARTLFDSVGQLKAAVGA